MIYGFIAIENKGYWLSEVLMHVLNKILKPLGVFIPFLYKRQRQMLVLEVIFQILSLKDHVFGLGFLVFFIKFIRIWVFLSDTRTNWNLSDAYVGTLLFIPVFFIPVSEDF